MNIKKSEFISALSQGHILCGVKTTVREVLPDRLERVLREIDSKPIDGYDLRYVARRASNHLEFSDGSRLYFDGFAKRRYFRRGSALAVMIEEPHAPMFKVIFYKYKEYI